MEERKFEKKEQKEVFKTCDLDADISHLIKNPPEPDYSIGWIYYILGLVGSFLFNDWITMWLLCTFVFWWWRKEKRDSESGKKGVDY